MTDRPILFSAPMVRALLAGTKTQTRRIQGLPTIEIQPNGNFHISNRYGGAANVAQEDVGTVAAEMMAIQPGDRIWVREAWHGDIAFDDIAPSKLDADTAIWYAADGSDLGLALKGKRRQSMYMPRWASRLTLLVTEVRVQRLQDISDTDAFTEGYPGRSLDGAWTPVGAALYADGCDAIHWYRELWERINGPGSWAANPWVVAYTFTVHQQNIDAMDRLTPALSEHDEGGATRLALAQKDSQA